ncbi:efflux RND transporter periplasmic adaptor subunit [Oleiagrimonas sp. C23AA]|uniref:efflux RND transporter periplasmic adaptor subunit n=1 Tax=Oleiagrimonas sp. C23AA TaxID=2719047 RepID=UPI00141D923D|nr:efflux RND transporter periplasmic adaptor subunit [Oleiagrimonas sp. C23AA]
MSEGDLLEQLKIDRGQREDGSGHGRRWPWLAGVVVLLVALGAGFWWWQQRPVQVNVVSAERPQSGAAAAAVLQATGYVTARRQATVSAQITGTLTQVLIEEGDHVRKGQVLARLEDKAQRADLDAAQASAAAAHAQIGQDRAQLRQAERDMRRQESLVRRGLVTRQAAEQAQTQVDALHAQVDADRKRAAAADAQVAVARVQFGYTVVRAPFAGVITAKAAQVGEIVSPLSAGGGFTRTGVGTIVDMDSLEVDVDVNEAYIGRVKPGMPAQAVLDAYPDWSIPAHVIAIVPAADRGKATVPVRVALDAHDERIVPDMGVRVSFLEKRQAPGRQAPDGVLIPASAIVRRGGHETVFVADGDTARAHAVSPAKGSYGDLKRIPAGLNPGTRVIDHPPAGLQDGDRIRIAKPAS